MALFKCKMCGGELEISNGMSVATCEYCGTKQTLPKLDDEKRAMLYDRANHFRRNNEFDKAMGIYEQILNEDNTDAEAYWSLVLCRYGIEYVEDPSSRKRIPTVNRAQFTSIFDDDNYKSALQYADGNQKAIYEEEAKAINEIQKGILAISQREEPFDVFICYKETDNNGRRTPDSVLANDLYHQLTQEGFKVFFARITLEDKLGSAYEPYIFAALNSAKVMVVLGTKPDHFKAVWVRNEWSRYLSLIKSGAKKMLIPAYKDMDPYDLPDEFAHLQAQDMSKLGFMQDLIRGIKKITGTDVLKETIIKETVVTNTNVNTAPLLKRAFMFLEDGDWNSANEYCEKVLDIDPENPSAYLAKLMAEYKVKKQESLKNLSISFVENTNYQKVVRFADDRLKEELAGYLEIIDERIENNRKDGIYSRARRDMCERNIIKYESAISLFKSIAGWKDSDELIIICQQGIADIEAEKEARRIEAERQMEAKRKRLKRKRLAVACIITIICLFIVTFALWDAVIIPKLEYNRTLKEYNRALGMLERGDYIDAYETLISLDGFSDSAEIAASIYVDYSFEKFKEADLHSGDYICLGSYEQDNNFANGKEPIDWIVLDVKNGKALLVSQKVLSWQKFDEESAVWHTSSLREWLNSSFIEDAFSKDLREAISTVKLFENGAEHNPNPEETTQDKIFVLSAYEESTYFSSGEKVYTSGYVKYLSNRKRCGYWLRTASTVSGAVVCTDNYSKSTSLFPDSYWGVRPAMWIDLNG